jgi:hypothetical protein
LPFGAFLKVGEVASSILAAPQFFCFVAAFLREADPRKPLLLELLLLSEDAASLQTSAF